MGDFLREVESLKNRFEQFSCLPMRLLLASSQFDNLPSRQLFSTRFDKRTRLIPAVLRENFV